MFLSTEFRHYGKLAGLVVLAALASPASGQEAKWPLAAPGGDHKMQEIPLNTPFILKADQVTMSDKGDKITADGAVEVTQENRVLRADHLEFDKKTNMIRAVGNISLSLETGDVIYGDLALADQKLNDGLVENFRMLMLDNSRMVGTQAAFSKDKGKEINRAIYSPCNLCASDPSRAPLWQIKSSRTTHDEVKHVMIYHDAWLQIYGVPVFYTPYFSSPDSTVKRQSGFLAPKFGIANATGFFAEIPYFWAINQSQDLTISPHYYSTRGEGAAAEYRQRFNAGYLRLAGSGVWATPPGDSNRKNAALYGNFAGDGGVNINDNWRAGFLAERVSDPSYLTDFTINHQFTNQDFTPASNYYQNMIYGEGFYGKDYHRIAAMGFESKSFAASANNLSVVHPAVQNSFNFKLDDWVGSGRVNQNILWLSHPDNSNVERLVEQVYYNIPMSTRDGQVFTWQTNLRGDVYQIYLPDNNRQGLKPFKSYLGRVIPQSALRWDFPLLNQIGGTSIVVQPTTQIVLAPRGLNNIQIPNNDSQSFDLNQGNLFSLQRFAGLDRIASGSRIDYAIKTTALNTDSTILSGFIGQSWRADSDLIYPVGSGADRQLSDVLLGSEYWPIPSLLMSFQMRLDNRDFRPTYQQETIGLYRSFGVFNVSYIENSPRLRSDAVALQSAQQGFISPLSRSLAANAVIKFDSYWRWANGISRDLVKQQWSYLKSAIIYHDECFSISLNYNVTSNEPISRSPNQVIALRFSFKYLGDSSFAFGPFQ